jgi:catechol 2,3-dioxygenase-like lactoylglutathione lyase family enzyme
MMLDHITIAVADFSRSRAFYDAALAPLGIMRLYADGDKVAGYGRDGKAFFWIAEQDRNPSQTHVAFKATDRDAVSAFHEAALANGGSDNGLPGPRPQYHDRYFAAFALDPDGNNIEAVIQ